MQSRARIQGSPTGSLVPILPAVAPSETRSSTGSLAGESSLVPGHTPWECLAREAALAPGQSLFLWEAPGGESFSGIGTVCRMEGRGAGRFEEARQGLTALLADAEHRGPAPAGFPGPIAIGGFSFAERGARVGRPGWPRSDALFAIPARTFWRARSGETVETRWMMHGPPPEDAGSVAEGPAAAPPGDPMARARWSEIVRESLDRIREGEFSKVVLARTNAVPLRESTTVLAILDSLRGAYPHCYRFLIADGTGNAFLGASPERLVRLAGGQVLTEAVAGTLRCDAGDDVAVLGQELAGSEKNRSEHRIVLEHLLETLKPVCETIDTPQTPEVMRLPHLLHLRTQVLGRPRAGAHVLDLVSRLHPTPAVAGWPRQEALAWIARAEAEDRGWYAGPVGWVDAKGNGDFAVGIRSITVQDRVARIFAGAGIVEGSDPELEWREIDLKMKGILDAIARD